MTDTDRLEELARAATPGEWQAVDYPLTGWMIRTVYVNADGWRVTAWPASVDCGEQVDKDNAAFIAAANPATVLALIAELNTLREAARLDGEAISGLISLYERDEGAEDIAEIICARALLSARSSGGRDDG